MTNVLVTGGCGFIGSNLTRSLIKKGWQVDVVDDMSNGHLELLEDIKMRVIPVDLLDHFYEKNLENASEVHVIQGDFSNPSVLNNIKSSKYDYVFQSGCCP